MNGLNLEPATQNKNPPTKRGAKPGRKPNNFEKPKDVTLVGLRRAVHEEVRRLKQHTIHDILDVARRVCADRGVSWYVNEGNSSPVVVEGTGLMWRFNIELVGEFGQPVEIEASWPVTVVTSLDLVSPMTARFHAELAFVQSFMALYRDFYQIFQAAAASVAHPVDNVQATPSQPTPAAAIDQTGFPEDVVDDLLDHVQPDGVPIFKSPYDSPHDVATNVGVISSIAENFLRSVQSNSAVQEFGEQNKDVLEYLQDFNKVQYDKLMTDIKTRWQQLTGG
jgi:hypothetical protein